MTRGVDDGARLPESADSDAVGSAPAVDPTDAARDTVDGGPVDPGADEGAAEIENETSGETRHPSPEADDPDAADAADDPDAADDAPDLVGRDPRWAKVLISVGVVFILLAAGAVGAERMLAKRYDKSVNHQTLLAPHARTTADDRRSSVSGPLNFLLLGSDARENTPEAGERSDTIIVAHIPESMDTVYVISIPRDLQVQIPSFTATGFAGSFEKINGAFEYGGGGTGGVQLVSQTLSDLMGIQFDGAAIIDFGGFRKVVDQLGGVDMCVDQRTESIHIGFDANGEFLPPRLGPEGEMRNPESTPKVYEPGCWHFAGWEALDYVRQRKTLPNGDYDRQRHQQEFLRAVGNAVKNRGLITNPLGLDKLVRAVGNSLTVDTNGVRIDELAYALRSLDPASFTGVTVPSEPQMIGGISYIVGLPAAEDLYRAIREDTLDAWAKDNSTWISQM